MMLHVNPQVRTAFLWQASAVSVSTAPLGPLGHLLRELEARAHAVS